MHLRRLFDMQSGVSAVGTGNDTNGIYKEGGILGFHHKSGGGAARKGGSGLDGQLEGAGSRGQASAIGETW